MIESVVYSTNLSHYERLRLGCHDCKHCYVALEKKTNIRSLKSCTCSVK